MSDENKIFHGVEEVGDLKIFLHIASGHYFLKADKGFFTFEDYKDLLIFSRRIQLIFDVNEFFKIKNSDVVEKILILLKEGIKFIKKHYETSSDNSTQDEQNSPSNPQQNT